MLEHTKFIWLNESQKNSYAEFFDTFEVEKGQVCVNISVDGDYVLYVNGEYASSSQYGDFEHYKIYDTIDISSKTKQGKNTIAILAWHFGEDSSRYKKYKAGLAFEIIQDERVILSSSKATKSRKSPTYISGLSKKISSQLGFSYSYDATKEDAFPKEISKDFSQSFEVEKKCEFFPRPIKKHTLDAPVFAKISSKSEDSCHYVLDLGKEYVGYLTFDIFANEETDINVAYGEHLDNGHVRRQIGDRDFSIDYRAKGGENKFTNYMLRFACRYLEIRTHSPIRLDKIGIIPQVYITKKTHPCLENELDREIYQMCLNTLECCMMEHYVDCPWREQSLYAFDSRNQMLAGYLAYEDKNKDYARANLLLISKDKRDDGLLSICYPAGIDLTIPSFSLHYITALCEYLENTGDKSLIYEVEHKIKEIIGAMLRNEKNGLIYSFEGSNHWNFYDWSRHQDGSLWNGEKSKPELTLTLLFINALCSYKKICQKCSLDFKYDNKIESLKSRIKEVFFDKEDGLFTLVPNEKAYHTLPNSLAILLDIPTDKERLKIAEKITQGELIEPSLSMKAFEYDALLSVDKSYINYIKHQIREVYGNMLKNGSSTVWETKMGRDDFDKAGSLCHGWSAIVIKYLLM